MYTRSRCPLIRKVPSFPLCPVARTGPEAQRQERRSPADSGQSEPSCHWRRRGCSCLAWKGGDHVVRAIETGRKRRSRTSACPFVQASRRSPHRGPPEEGTAYSAPTCLVAWGSANGRNGPFLVRHKVKNIM